MTWFGFDPAEDAQEREDLAEYAAQADVIIVDESHNFRNSATQRYKNLYDVVAPNERGRKKIVLLTATPINTRYEDLSNQFQILTHEERDHFRHPAPAAQQAGAAARQGDCQAGAGAGAGHAFRL